MTIINIIYTKIKSAAPLVFGLGVLWLCINYFGAWGLLGFVVANILIGVSIIWLKWPMFIDGIKAVETAIWGYPKEMLRKGEKRSKIKFVLNKRKWIKKTQKQ